MLIMKKDLINGEVQMQLNAKNPRASSTVSHEKTMV